MNGLTTSTTTPTLMCTCTAIGTKDTLNKIHKNEFPGGSGVRERERERERSFIDNQEVTEGQ